MKELEGRLESRVGAGPALPGGVGQASDMILMEEHRKIEQAIEGTRSGTGGRSQPHVRAACPRIEER